MKKFSNTSNITKLRQEAGLTQVQLAKLVGVTANTIQNWEKDSAGHQIEKYIKLCQVLNCQLSDLININYTLSYKQYTTQLAILRKKAGLTQSKLAKLVGVTVNTIQNWEKDSAGHQIEKYIKLCQVLNCQLSDLISQRNGQFSDSVQSSVKSRYEQERRRGFLLTEIGLGKLREAIIYAEFSENKGYRFTLEYLSERTGLSVDTCSKILNNTIKADKSSLKCFFEAFNLILEKDDYYKPTASARVPLTTNHSLFPTRIPVEISDLTLEQVKDLVQIYKLNWSTQEMSQLISFLRSNPYLIHLVIYHVWRGDITLKELLSQSFDSVDESHKV